ncbi:MAG: cache domain-containing protein [Acidobacteriia bacterium]|nr:cache domain-containing protein [Terriglobia bacterium]
MAAAGLLALAGFWLSSERSRILGEKKEKIQNLVEIPYSILTKYQQMEIKGKLNRVEAQKQALEAIRTMRYSDTNYFWINDMHPTMVMHPIKPEMDGKDLTDYKDPQGKPLFLDAVASVRKSGSGFVAYLWPKPGKDKDKPVAKLSYVKGFEAWGWVIGTGIYIDDVDEAWRESALKAGALALACLVALLVVAAGVSRSIFRRLGEMVERIKDVAQGEGDLTKRIQINSDDEVAELGRWFNTFIEKLEATIAQVAASTHRLASASEEISATSHEQARGADMQKDQTQQVATAMQEMASTVQQVSENSNHAAGASQKAAEAARHGGTVLEGTLAKMHAMASSVGETAKKVHELGKRSEQIGEIIRVIDDIADQTNLLALNAAIEAARAGEQGRGFAVVADEVRKLAERTSKATKEIAEMIRGIQEETRAAVAAMEAGTREVEIGVQSTREAGTSLQEIIQMSEQVGDMISHIATAATQQSAATEQVNGSIDQIAKITETSTAGVQQSAKAFAELSDLAFDLQQLVGQFRVGANAQEGKRPASSGHSASSPDGKTHHDHQRATRTSQLMDGLSQSMDFSRVKIAHRSWRRKLREFLDGQASLDPNQLGSHQSCELGRWIYADGVTKYSEVHDFQKLETQHKRMHATVREVVELKLAGNSAEAEQRFTSMYQLAETVVALLTSLESQVTQSPAQAVAVGK